jgi:hypothetical protein
MMEGKIDINKLSMSQRQVEYIPNEFEEDIAPRFRRFNERLDDDVFFRYNNHRMDYKEKIKKVLFYILFGNSFMIYIREDEIEEVNEDDIYSLYDEYYLYMQGFPNNMNEIKEELFGKTRILR